MWFWPYWECLPLYCVCIAYFTWVFCVCVINLIMTGTRVELKFSCGSQSTNSLDYRCATLLTSPLDSHSAGWVWLLYKMRIICSVENTGTLTYVYLWQSIIKRTMRELSIDAFMEGGLFKKGSLAVWSGWVCVCVVFWLWQVWMMHTVASSCGFLCRWCAWRFGIHSIRVEYIYIVYMYKRLICMSYMQM